MVATEQRGIRDKRDSCEMIDGYVAIVPRELQVTAALPQPVLPRMIFLS